MICVSDKLKVKPSLLRHDNCEQNHCESLINQCDCTGRPLVLLSFHFHLHVYVRRRERDSPDFHRPRDKDARASSAQLTNNKSPSNFKRSRKPRPQTAIDFLSPCSTTRISGRERTCSRRTNGGQAQYGRSTRRRAHGIRRVRRRSQESSHPAVVGAFVPL